MHYRNGREAKEGDPVVFIMSYPAKAAQVGKIHRLVPGSTSCNCVVASIIPGGVEQGAQTIGDLYHAEDALLAIQPDILAPKA